MSTTTVKLSYNSEIRKVGCVASYEDLVDTCSQIYTLSPTSLKFHYLDEDEDLITISQEDDIQEMFKFFGQKTPKILISVEEPKPSILESIDLADSLILEEKPVAIFVEANQSSSIGTGPEQVYNLDGGIQTEPDVQNISTDVNNLIKGNDAEVNTHMIE